MRVSERRHLLNRREFALLDHLLTETEPTDPFSEHPSTQIRLADLVNSPYVRGTYHDITRRTFIREIRRLAELGFITLADDPGSRHQLIGIDFGEIGAVLHHPVLHHQPPPHLPESLLDLPDVGAVIRVHELPDRPLAQPHRPRQADLGHPLFAHGGVERKLGRDDQRDRDRLLSGSRRFRHRDVFATLNVGPKRHRQGVFRHREGLLPIVTARQRLRHMRERDGVAAVLLGSEHARVCVPHQA